MIRVLDKNDANDVGDGGTSDGEGEGYKCIVAFQEGMKKWIPNACVLMHMKLRVV